MKVCPHCKAELDDNARFCLCCMTSLDDKEQIPPPVLKFRRWPFVLSGVLCLGIILCLILIRPTHEDSKSPSVPQITGTQSTPDNTVSPNTPLSTYVTDGVRYTFRPATREEHPTAVSLDNCYVLVRVEGVPADGIYRVPSFVGDDTNALVTAIADGAFADTDARAIDLGYNVRYVWGNAFGSTPLSDLFLHEDVLIDPAAFDACSGNLIIHCPDYLENTQGQLWSDLAIASGFQWQPEDF